MHNETMIKTIIIFAFVAAPVFADVADGFMEMRRFEAISHDGYVYEPVSSAMGGEIVVSRAEGLKGGAPNLPRRILAAGEITTNPVIVADALYVPTSRGLQLFDTTQPDEPRPLRLIPSPAIGSGCEALCIGTNDTLAIRFKDGDASLYDITDIFTPASVSNGHHHVSEEFLPRRHPLPKGLPMSEIVTNGISYCACADIPLAILRPDHSPVLAEREPGERIAIAASIAFLENEERSFVAVADYGDGLRVYDVTDPDSPSLAAHVFRDLYGDLILPCALSVEVLPDGRLLDRDAKRGEVSISLDALCDKD